MSILALTLACSLAYTCTLTGHSNGADWCEATLGPAAESGAEYIVVEGVGTDGERRCAIVDELLDPTIDEEYRDLERAIVPLRGAK